MRHLEAEYADMKMQPFYKNQGVRLFEGDVVDVLNSLPDESIDLPPCNLLNDGFTCHAGKCAGVNKGKWGKSNGVEKDYQYHYNRIEACRMFAAGHETLLWARKSKKAKHSD